MANMSYCRFRNTIIDLEDCFDALDDRDIESDEEKEAAKRILKMMAEFLIDNEIIYFDEDGLGEYININYEAIKDIIE